MDNLFDRDYQQETNLLREKIKTHIASFYEKNPDRKFKLQVELNNYRALSFYQNIRENEKILNIINNFRRFIPFLDSSEKKFVEEFPKRCNTAVLELVMANFFNTQLF